MRKLKRTYKNWLEGKICPFPTFIQKGSSVVNCHIIWEDFSEEDLKAIRSKQKEIFEDSVLKLLDKLVVLFNTEYQQSKAKEQLLLNTIKKWEEVLFYLKPTFGANVVATQSDLVFEKNRYVEMRQYIKSVYEVGEVVDYSFIHSQYCLFYDQRNLDAKIEAEVYYRFWEMLKKKHMTETKSPEKINQELNHNPHPEIFKDYHAFKMFEGLAKNTVLSRTRTADYAYIFHKMNNSKLGLIISSVTQPYFIKFLNNKYEAKITSRKLPFVNPKRKQLIFEKALEDYHNLVRSETN
jgi:hypothetical protein